jgi:hypothetical protein
VNEVYLYLYENYFNDCHFLHRGPDSRQLVPHHFCLMQMHNLRSPSVDEVGLKIDECVLFPLCILCTFQFILAWLGF